MRTFAIANLAAALTLAPVLLYAQPTPAVPPANTLQTFFLKSADKSTSQNFSTNEADEILSALRNLLPADARVILAKSQGAIIVRSTPENILIAQKLINQLDVPRKSYRLTYTVTEFDGIKMIGAQRFSMTAIPDYTSKLKQGSKIPIATGAYNPVATTGDSPRPAGTQTQFTYLDIGMNFDSDLSDDDPSPILFYTVEQSSLAPETSGLGPQDPILRQTSISGRTAITLNKPVLLGSIDIPGSTRRLDVEVLMTPIP
jgi:hypothetical protein